jgi:hypothetical protein
MMDTKTLVVGQDVFIISGCYGDKGKVVEVGPSGVNVLIPRRLPLEREELLRFDNNGKGSDAQGTRECGPWYIVETPTPELRRMWAAFPEI